MKKQYTKSVCAMCGEEAYYMNTRPWKCNFCGAISVYDRIKKMPLLHTDYKAERGKEWRS